MADLEKLALRRDRGYLVRLITMLLLGGLASTFVFEGLTGGSFGSCAAGAMLGKPASNDSEGAAAEDPDGDQDAHEGDSMP